MYSIAASRGPPSFTKSSSNEDLTESAKDFGSDNKQFTSSYTLSQNGKTNKILETNENINTSDEEVFSRVKKLSSVAAEERCTHTTIQPSSMMTLALELQASNGGKASEMFRKGKLKAQDDDDCDENFTDKNALANLWIVPNTAANKNSPSTATHLQSCLANEDFIFEKKPMIDIESQFLQEIETSALDSNLPNIDDLTKLLAAIDVAELVGSPDNIVQYSSSDDDKQESIATNKVAQASNQGFSRANKVQSEKVATTITDNKKEQNDYLRPKSASPQNKDELHFYDNEIAANSKDNSKKLSVNYDLHEANAPELSPDKLGKTTVAVDHLASNKVVEAFKVSAIDCSELSKYPIHTAQKKEVISISAFNVDRMHQQESSMSSTKEVNTDKKNVASKFELQNNAGLDSNERDPFTSQDCNNNLIESKNICSIVHKSYNENLKENNSYASSVDISIDQKVGLRKPPLYYSQYEYETVHDIEKTKLNSKKNPTFLPSHSLSSSLVSVTSMESFSSDSSQMSGISRANTLSRVCATSEDNDFQTAIGNQHGNKSASLDRSFCNEEIRLLKQTSHIHASPCAVTTSKSSKAKAHSNTKNSGNCSTYYDVSDHPESTFAAVVSNDVSIAEAGSDFGFKEAGGQELEVGTLIINDETSIQSARDEHGIYNTEKNLNQIKFSGINYNSSTTETTKKPSKQEIAKETTIDSKLVCVDFKHDMAFSCCGRKGSKKYKDLDKKSFIDKRKSYSEDSIVLEHRKSMSDQLKSEHSTDKVKAQRDVTFDKNVIAHSQKFDKEDSGTAPKNAKKTNVKTDITNHVVKNELFEPVGGTEVEDHEEKNSSNYFRKQISVKVPVITEEANSVSISRQQPKQTKNFLEINKNPRVEVIDGSKIRLKRSKSTPPLPQDKLSVSSVSANGHLNSNDKADVSNNEKALMHEPLRSSKAFDVQSKANQDKVLSSASFEENNMPSVKNVGIDVETKKLKSVHSNSKKFKVHVSPTTSRISLIPLNQVNSLEKRNENGSINVAPSRIIESKEKVSDPTTKQKEFPVVLKTSAGPLPSNKRELQTTVKQDILKGLKVQPSKNAYLVRTNTLPSAVTKQFLNKRDDPAQQKYSSRVYVSMQSSTNSNNDDSSSLSKRKSEEFSEFQESKASFERGLSQSSRSPVGRTLSFSTFNEGRGKIKLRQQYFEEAMTDAKTPTSNSLYRRNTVRVVTSSSNPDSSNSVSNIREKLLRNSSLKYEKKNPPIRPRGLRTNSVKWSNRRDLPLFNTNMVREIDENPAGKASDEDNGIIDTPMMKVKDIRAKYKVRDYENYAKPKTPTGSDKKIQRKPSEEFQNRSTFTDGSQTFTKECKDSNCQVAQQVMSLFQGALDFEKELAVFEEESASAFAQHNEAKRRSMENGPKIQAACTSKEKNVPPPIKMKSSSWTSVQPENDLTTPKTDIKASIERIKSESEAVASFDESLDQFYNVLSDLYT